MNTNIKDYIYLSIKVKSSAKNNKIKDFIFIDNKPYLIIEIKEQAINGLANKAIIKFLSKEFGIPQTSIEIIKGITSKIKTLAIKNMTQDYFIKYIK